MRLLLIAVLMLATGCASPDTESVPSEEPSAPETAAPEPPAPEPPVSLAEILSFIDGNGDESRLVARLAMAGDVTVTTEENRHTLGQIDTVRTLRFPGLTVEAYEVRGGPTFIREVDVTGEGYTSGDGLGVGSSRETIEAVFGAPIHEVDGRQIYETSDEAAPTTVEVGYDDAGTAVRMTWRPYVD